MSYHIPVSVKGVVIENSKVWLRSNERNEWELPGGKMDRGEQPKDTAIREIEEELGLLIEPKELLEAYLYKIDFEREVLVIAYLCKVVKKIGDLELVGEVGEVGFKRYALSEILDLNMPFFYKEIIKEGFNRL